MKKILILYPGFPHYRKGIIEKLIESDKFNLYFAGDINNYIKNIKPYIFDSEQQFYNIKSFRYKSFVFHKNLISYVLQNKFDGAIVHSSPYYITIFIAVLILKIKGVQIFNWAHGILDNNKNFKNYLYYKFFNVFDGLLLYGSYAKKNLISFGYKADKLKVIYNSLDYENQIIYRDSIPFENLFDLRKSFFEIPGNPQLIFIGRLTPQKKLPFLINAIKQLKDNNIYVNMLFVGEGREKDDLKSMVAELELTNQVYFYGASYNEPTNYKLLASSDCCVSPGEVGLTAIHSLMYGTPVISHGDFNKQMPEVEAIIPNFNGDLFEKDNLDDLCEKIINVINLKRTLGEQLKKNCYEIIDQKFNPSYQLSIIEEIFR